MYMNKTVEGLFRQSFFSCPTISKFISLHFKYHRYFYSASENNKLESGKIRVNMLTRQFAFVPPCRGSRPFQFRESEQLFFGKQPTVAGLERIGGLIMEKR